MVENATNLTPHLNLRNKLAFFISIISFFFLVPGVTLAMLRIQTKGHVNAEITEMGINFFNTSNSILNTVHDLFFRGNHFVAIMIFTFSVVVPVVKGVSLIYAFLTRNRPRRKKIFNFIKSIGKWSMCDVFVVAIFLAYLSTGTASKHTTHDTTVLGIPLQIDVLVNMSAQLQMGFYLFLTYCLLSLIALQLYEPY